MSTMYTGVVQMDTETALELLLPHHHWLLKTLTFLNSSLTRPHLSFLSPFVLPSGRT